MSRTKDAFTSVAIQHAVELDQARTRIADLERDLSAALEAIRWYLSEANDSDSYVISDKRLREEAIERFTRIIHKETK